MCSPSYHGVVRWRLADRRVELIRDIARKYEFSTITFGKQGGNNETHQQCVTNFVAFVRACGIEAQWTHDGNDSFHRELWKAAIRVWGYPVWGSEH